jgi:hypothetical protein
VTERAEIVEPVTRRWLMGDMWTDQEFASMEMARGNGLQLSCLSGTVEIVIVGADGAVLSRYERRDNFWRDLCRGELVVTPQGQSCSCGGTPDVAVEMPYQHEPTMGWYWSCERCGAWLWSHVDPCVKKG